MDKMNPKLTEGEITVRSTQEGEIIRPAFVLEGDGVSIDLMTPDGKHVARINAFKSNGKDTWFDVDVILAERIKDDPDWTARILHFHEGRTIVAEPMQGSISAVDIRHKSHF